MTGYQQLSDASTNRQQLDAGFALQAAGLGIWEYNPATGLVNWDARARALFGIGEGNNIPYKKAIQHIHPDDQQRVNEAVQRALDPQLDGLYDQTYRTIGVDDGQFRWVRFQGKGHFTPTGELSRFGGIAQEVTQQALDHQNLEASEARFRLLIEEAPLATSLFLGRELRVAVANQPMLAIWGKGPNQVGKTLAEILPEITNQPFLAILDNVYTTGQTYSAKGGRADLIINGVWGTYYFDFIYKPLFDANQQVYGILQMAADVTEQVLAQQRIDEMQAEILTSFEQGPVAIALIEGAELTFRMANPFYAQLTGRPSGELLGKPLLEALPELAGQGFDTLLNQVIASGQPYTTWGTAVEVVRQGKAEVMYVNFTYQPQRRPDGQISGVLIIANEVTQLVTARQQVEQTQEVLRQSEARLQKVIASKTVGILFFSLNGQMREANETFLQMSGYSQEELLGALHWRTLTDPNYWNITAQSAQNLAVRGETPPYEKQMVRPDGSHWWGLFAPARLNGEGNESECVEFVIDITQRKQTEESLLESEAALQNAIELAELGTWRMDCQTGETQLSKRHADIFGLELTLLPFEQALVIVHPDDRHRVRKAFEAAMQPGTDGHYEAEYRIMNGFTGEHRHIRARGETSFDERGQPVFISGTAQDVTLERESQLLLESQVQQRTQELQLANQDLKRSNDNLQQFAYIASHDLQEPLRKIQSFSTLLEQQLEEQLTEVGKTYLQRITSAGARMSTLIKDLLVYSRISTRQQSFGLVSLEAIMAEVLSTLDWLIAERGAQIEADELPVVRGDESQLSQLFQNLLSNAIKFTPVGQTPQIQVQCFQRERSELPAEVKPTSEAIRFIQLSVYDQGIGFDTKYIDRIFQVFQRLHGKNEFPGTGVGLAICQRVVENHGGAITADSKPGEGATFCVYLPA